MNFTDTVTVIVTRPFTGARRVASVPYGRVGDAQFTFYPSIAAPFVAVENRDPSRHRAFDHVETVIATGTGTDKETHGSTIALDDRKDRRPVGLVSAVPALFVGTPPWRISRLAMRRAFFPPRSGTVRQLQRPCHRAPHGVVARRRCVARAGARRALVCVRLVVHERGVRSIHL